MYRSAALSQMKRFSRSANYIRINVGNIPWPRVCISHDKRMCVYACSLFKGASDGIRWFPVIECAHQYASTVSKNLWITRNKVIYVSWCDIILFSVIWWAMKVFGSFFRFLLIFYILCIVVFMYNRNLYNRIKGFLNFISLSFIKKIIQKSLETKSLPILFTVLINQFV